MYAEAPGLSGSLFTLLRDMIHERVGIFYDESNRDLLASKLASRMLELGFGSFLDYYYLLKYDAAAEAEWQHMLDALTVRETFFWREIDHGARAGRCAGATAGGRAARGAAADLERRLCDRRGAFDDRDRAAPGWLVRASADRDLRQRHQPAGDHAGAARGLPRALAPQSAGRSCAQPISRPRAAAGGSRRRSTRVCAGARPT